ncbi:MAG: glycosyltransferase family 2 protein [Chloroflexi bacterium]|nr:MAG: glycosyltransferase family 2 protein [Chloroflexota bacterium]
MPAVSVIITNWNGRRWLDDCFNALYAQSFQDFEIILVDDGSTDGSADWVAQHHPQVRLVRQEKHLGFAGANNVGIRVAVGENIVTLNNDTRADPNFLQELLNGLSAPDVGMVAAQMLIWDNPDLLDSAGIVVDWAGFGWNRWWQQTAVEHNTPGEVFGPCAGAALYRREMLEQIGLFDEDFYTYYEDVDLAWRARRAGWRCMYAPAARVLHFHSATGGFYSPRKVLLLSRNRLWAIIKNYAGRDLIWAFPILLAYELASLVLQLLKSRTLSPVRGRWQALLGSRRMFAKRLPHARRIKLARPVIFSQR